MQYGDDWLREPDTGTRHSWQQLRQPRQLFILRRFDCSVNPPSAYETIHPLDFLALQSISRLYHMPESKSPTSRKRQRSEQSDWNPAPSKKQKASPPAEFWDNLSIIWLTKRALKELDRRNIATVPHPTQSPRRQRPATRALRKSRSSLLSATEYLRRCEPGALKDIKAFAKQGGPDLSSLRNVCCAGEFARRGLTTIAPGACLQHYELEPVQSKEHSSFFLGHKAYHKHYKNEVYRNVR